MRFTYNAATVLSLACFPHGTKTKANGEVVHPSTLSFTPKDDSVTSSSHGQTLIFTQKHLKDLLPSAAGRLRRKAMKKKEAAGQFENDALGRLSRRRLVVCTYSDGTSGENLTSYNVRRLFYSTVKVMMLAMITIMVPVSYSLMECIVPTQNKANSYVVCLASFSVNRKWSNQDTRDRGEQLQWQHCVSGPFCNGLGEVGPGSYTGYSCSYRDPVVAGSIGNNSCNGYAACYNDPLNPGSFIVTESLHANIRVEILDRVFDLSSATCAPTNPPTLPPTAQPITAPPSSPPTTAPTSPPTTSDPTVAPTSPPTTSDPTVNPSSSPTKNPTLSPSSSPAQNPSSSPTKSLLLSHIFVCSSTTPESYPQPVFFANTEPQLFSDEESYPQPVFFANTEPQHFSDEESYPQPVFFANTEPQLFSDEESYPQPVFFANTEPQHFSDEESYPQPVFFANTEPQLFSDEESYPQPVFFANTEPQLFSDEESYPQPVFFANTEPQLFSDEESYPQPVFFANTEPQHFSDEESYPQPVFFANTEPQHFSDEESYPQPVFFANTEPQHFSDEESYPQPVFFANTEPQHFSDEESYPQPVFFANTEPQHFSDEESYPQPVFFANTEPQHFSDEESYPQPVFFANTEPQLFSDEESYPQPVFFANKVTATIPGQFSFNDTAGLSTLNTTQVRELAESLGSTIESIACENVTNSDTSCDVNVTSINGETFFQRRRLISRRLEALLVEYDVILKLFCSTDCSDTQTLATNITSEIQGTVEKSFTDGSLLSTLKNATDDSSVFAYLAPAKPESINFGAAVIFVTTAAPSKAPTASPTNSPSKVPTTSPTNSPSKAPTASPTNSPSKAPTASPTNSPSKVPTASPMSNSPVSSCSNGICELNETVNTCAADCGDLSLSSLDSGRKGAEGTMFDVKAKRDIEITSFDIYTNSAKSETVEVYTRQGSYKDHELSQLGWKLVYSKLVNQLGENIPTALGDFDTGVAIPANMVQSFFIWTDNVLRYDDGRSNVEGTLVTSDNALELYEGVGITSKFSGKYKDDVFATRVIKGVIRSITNIVLNSSQYRYDVVPPIVFSPTPQPTPNPTRRPVNTKAKKKKKGKTRKF
ncbi:predicted protein [Thalassiosira pseudonana CCMP1335]|uniref:Uncharacterized protein n=1 Tax=Thalassiosira pseudonana TaxID=35128 RepID=B8BSN8_THAPS|nr:predicted protein [Thalassiosira pseudonana CCMP1335]EED96161.1 predicted protein [Thalassiosira pseudonana CCMP1335]